MQIFLPKLLRFGGTFPPGSKSWKSLKKGGMSKPIQLDLVKKYTRSGHTDYYNKDVQSCNEAGNIYRKIPSLI